MNPPNPEECPLCGSSELHPLPLTHGRRYSECAECGLIHMAAADRPTLSAEREHYASHENDPADERYRSFLSRVADPLVERLSPGARGLDYGSGPGPTLSVMLEEQGFPMRIYDPIFAPDPLALELSYDFITCTETVEHFFRPTAEFDRFDRMLQNGGWLAVMTEAVDEERPFETWWYARDPTHVCFYRARTMEWLGRHYGWSLETPRRNVSLFRKPELST